MKKLLSLILALTLALTMGVTAFAANGTGSIEITNATVGVEYSVYKLFDATYSATGDAVSYSIKTTDQFFNTLFSLDANNNYVNAYFNYDPVTGTVTKKATVNDTELVTYLTGIINAVGASYAAAATPITATTTTVKFDNLPYGYYVIKSTLGSTVTINSNTPDVKVIDKNQQGATDFNKQIKTGTDTWGDENSACFGDTVEYKITFNATNYDAANQVQFYSVYDTTGTAIAPDFNTITVKVGGVTLNNGYFIGTGAYASTSTALNGWDGANFATTADWYLVQSGEHDFRISIPWMTNHTLNGNGTAGYSLTFGTDAVSKFSSPVTVEITYKATVKDNATIGGMSYNVNNSNNTNTAHVKWYFVGGTDSTINDTVHTYVYGIGVLKEDSATLDNLAGAEFEVYTDQDCTNLVNFVETGIKGVYNHDDNGSVTTVVSQANGKIVLLGLKSGTYYLKEVKAPDGYNALSSAVAVEVGEGKSEDFSVFANANGEVADTEQDIAGYTKHTYGVTKATVGNSKGVELPSTGGKGTTMLITIGSLIAIGFAIFLITNKKMSAYTD